jgi:hypothetical protein
MKENFDLTSEILIIGRFFVCQKIKNYNIINKVLLNCLYFYMNVLSCFAFKVLRFLVPEKALN